MVIDEIPTHNSIEVLFFNSKRQEIPTNSGKFEAALWLADALSVVSSLAESAI